MVLGKNLNFVSEINFAVSKNNINVIILLAVLVIIYIFLFNQLVSRNV